jgi:hypothetical protein
MKAKILSPLPLFAVSFVLLALSANAAPQPEPEQNGNYRYEVNPSSGANISLFKLFTIQPLKKDAPEKKHQPAPAVKPEKKVAEPSYIDRMRKLL